MKRWKDINGFPGYRISDHGEVYSSPRTFTRNGHKVRLPGKLLKPRALDRGHLYVNLRVNNKSTSTYIHRLVAMHFIGPQPDGKLHVAHWDGDASNNHVSNLRWASAAENNADSVRLGRSSKPSGVLSKTSKLDDLLLTKVFERYNNGKSARSISEEFNLSHQTVSCVLNGTSYIADVKRLGLITEWRGRVFYSNQYSG